MKRLLYIAGALGLSGIIYLIYSKGKSMLDFWKWLNITPRLDGGIGNMKLDVNGLHIPLAVDFANRSEQKITVAVPAVDIILNKKAIGISTPNTQSVLIAPNSISTLTGIINLSSV